VVVATFWKTANFVNQLPSAKGAKAIFIQGYEVQDGESNPRLDATWRMPMHKIVVSKWLLEIAEKQFGDSSVSLVPNSVDTELFSAPARGKQPVPTVGVIYSPSWFKGCRTSFAALDTVASKFSTLRVICFGAERPVRSLRLPSNAEFYYQPRQEDIKKLYAQCDVWLCGSNRDGFALPPLEAMACRCPVVTTRVGAMPQLVEEGVNGHLVEIGDAKSLSERVMDVLALCEKRWQQMSEAAYRTAISYTWDQAADRFEEALRQAMQKRRTVGKQSGFELVV
jgi:glycosyltransferase involved in cell wall biosynthesis